MSVCEFHFSSEVFSDQVAYSGNKNRRLLELNEPIRIFAFHVRDVQLPLFFSNITKAGTVTFRFRYDAEPIQTAVRDVPAGLYTASSFSALITTYLRGLTPYAPLDPDFTQTSASILPDGSQLELFFPAAMHTNPGNNRINFDFEVEFSENLEYQLSVPTPNKAAIKFSFVGVPILQNTTLLSPYAIRLVPNAVFLHSNLMSHTRHNSISRAIGGYASRTILTRIPIDQSYTWGESIMPWTNPAMDKDFMFKTEGEEIGKIEFWFTDEFGNELDFNNVQFALSLMCLM
jgi:hypothetical protein